MAREKVDNKLNVVIGTKAQVLDDTTIPDNSIVIVTDEELKANEIVYDDDRTVEEAIYERTNMVNITYQELKDLRDNEKLVSGTFYRITDYETTTVQVETRSAGNLFDVIVQALDNKTLSENAQAIHSVRDTNGYFNGMRLEAWELKYTLENDRFKHYWADTVNGKGVIYQMIDEFENDLPYDFKNIQFKRYIIDEYPENTELEGRYFALKDLNENVIPSGVVIDSGDFIWAYTFTVIDENDVVNDVSLNTNKTFTDDVGEYHYIESNKFGYFDYSYYDDVLEQSFLVKALGNNVMLYDYDFYGGWEFYGYCYNTIGNDFNSSTIENDFNYNTIGDDFSSNIIRNYFSSNTIGDDFSSNTVGSGFSSNVIRNYFNYNIIGDNFNHNTIVNYFSSNTIGDDFSSNTVGSGFSSNVIKNYFNYNTIGNSIRYIQFSVDGTFLSIIRNLYIRSGLIGASNTNKLDLYYSGLYNRKYPTYIEQIANGNIVSIHQETPLVWAGKKKTSNTSGTWEDI